MARQRIAVLGGTGFVGRHLANHWVGKGHVIVIPTRRPERHRELGVLPTVKLAAVDIHDDAQLTRLLAGCDTAVNLVGILNEGHRGGFERAHVEFPRRLIMACRQASVGRLLHMSALNASLDAPSRYLRTKAEGERLVLSATDLMPTVFKPSVIFGPDDHFFNRFAALLRLAPGVFPLACSNSRFAPVYIQDVVRAYAAALEYKSTAGQAYELCGPRAYTLRELVEYTARTLELRRKVIGLPDALARAQAALLGFLPGKPFTKDNYLSLQVDSVCREGFPDFIGVKPTALEAIVPFYAGKRGRQSRLDAYRNLRDAM